MSIFTRLIGERPAKQDLAPPAKALDWAKRIYAVGAKLPPNVFPPTEETAGYIIPTLQCGERRWRSISPDGKHRASSRMAVFCWQTECHTPSIRLRCSGVSRSCGCCPELSEPLRRAPDYVASQIADEARCLRSPMTWRVADGGMFSDYCHLYVLGRCVKRAGNCPSLAT